MGKIEIGPIGLLPPSAASMGIFQPEKGSGLELVEGEHMAEDKAYEKFAVEMLTRRNPTLFPGPMIVWGWNEEARHKAEMALRLVKEIPGMNIIPMPDYRPIYPKIDPEAVINPCHPNLTVQHNKIHVCALIGVHCHFANITLKMIRAGTNCYTTALCAYDGHEDALLSVSNLDETKLEKIIQAVIKVRESGVVTPWAYTPEGKEELEEIRASKEKNKASSKEGATIFMQDKEMLPLEQGLDENAE
ncbi:MAG: 2-oxoglutarate:ferredoxin oxidoreductase [Candidatus Nitrohelix vancouverensis]|uniref:2-oxoglutarate:ferredoxin oxidoreductase n=1 Tax=Candidatus Nitrohelix vancouverensis TaxID=2705534 RepID=A0A7T0G462_9BACT|nr:MAG: 2-oxoglutarate:ferredoxin oxidoreductase [Candidatus Nitrohelix vancouverensis]